MIENDTSPAAQGAESPIERTENVANSNVSETPIENTEDEGRKAAAAEPETEADEDEADETPKAGEKPAKLIPVVKKCPDCGEIKDRMKDFNPRWGHCLKHKPFDPKCDLCIENRNKPTRQPRCKTCDSKRRKTPAKTGGKAKAPKAKGGGKKKTKAPSSRPEAPSSGAKGQKSTSSKEALRKKLRSGLKGPPRQARLVDASRTNIQQIREIALTIKDRDEPAVAKAEVAYEQAAQQGRRARRRLSEAKATDDGPAIESARAAFKKARTRQVQSFVRLKNAQEWRQRSYERYALTTQQAIDRCTASHSYNDPKKPMIRAQAELPILRHLLRVQDEMRVCYQIQANSPNKDALISKLIDSHKRVLCRFSNARQTRLEPEDARAEAIKGILDAALRFDPSKVKKWKCWCCGWKIDAVKEFADKPSNCEKCGAQRLLAEVPLSSFSTYAWWWIKRNSRCRNKSQERPGLMPSIHDPKLGGRKDAEDSVAGQVESSDGRRFLGALKTKGRKDDTANTTACAVVDLRREIESLTDPIKREILVGLLREEPIDEIAGRLGISRNRANRLKDETFERLRSKLGGN